MSFYYRIKCNTILSKIISMPLGQFGKIALGWTLITVSGIYGFVWSKRQIDRNRYESMQIRQRMRNSNTGEYEQVGNRRFSG